MSAEGMPIWIKVAAVVFVDTDGGRGALQDEATSVAPLLGYDTSLQTNMVVAGIKICKTMPEPQAYHYIMASLLTYENPAVKTVTSPWVYAYGASNQDV